MNNIEPGRYQMRNGQYAEVHSQKTMNAGKVKFWHGAVLSHLSHRGGMQNAWNLDGADMSGNTDLDLVARAVTELITSQ